MVIPLTTLAETSVELEVPELAAWTGQRIPFFITLRADGTFDGAASFDLPRIPESVILKLGNPVLGSLTEDNTEYFTQRHEFALFSQASGAVELPPITVRFAHRKGYTGPSFDVALDTEGARLGIERPPGSSGTGFLVTTDSLDIRESWDPPPGPVETGAVFKRTIVQRASNLTGIALAPAPAEAPDGVRVYAGEPVVSDRIDRGELRGERRETITYLVEQPGRHTLPAIRYDWWNPSTRQLESRTLPEAGFTASAPPPPPASPSRAPALVALLVVLAAILATHFRHVIHAAGRRLRDRIDPPRRRLERRFLRACHHDDPAAAWLEWSKLRPLRPDLPTSAEFESRLVELQRRRFGPVAGGAWSGKELARAYRGLPDAGPSTPAASPLPPLNS